MLSKIFGIAKKDLKLLWRDKMAAFFILGFPVVMGLFFGNVFGGSGAGQSDSSIKLLVVDLDQSAESQQLIASLKNQSALQVDAAEQDAAADQVRVGEATAFLAIPSGFGKTAGVVWQKQLPLELGVDPSRSAEGAMLEGMLMQASGELMMQQFQDTDRTRQMIQETKEQALASDDLSLIQKGLLSTMYGSFDSFMASLDQVQQQNDGESTSDAGFQMQLAEIKRVPVTRNVTNAPPSGFAISFPQGMIWGVLGCCAGFAISIARERSRGTLVRLQASPLSITQILLGKGLACFLAVNFVLGMMTALGFLLGMTPGQPGYLVVTCLLTAYCFVGIMMLLAVLGKSEESVSGISWAVNVVMAMLGGGMIPLFVMGPFFRTLSMFSPVRWAIYSLEGAIWRQLTFQELLLPWLVLTAVGTVGMAIGSLRLRQSLAVH